MAYGTGNSVRNVFNPSSAVTNPAKTGFVFAGRQLNGTNQIQLPLAGQQYPSPYIPVLLSAYKNGAAAANALQAMGFNYVQGYTVNEEIVAPTSIETDPITGITSLTWDTVTTGLENITGTIASGSATQLSTTASATLRGNVILDPINETTTLNVIYIDASPEFNLSGAITITASIATLAPDITLSDEVVVFAYWYFEKYKASAVFTTSPQLYISILITGRDVDVVPLNANISLIEPTSVSILFDTSVNLTYPITAANLGLLPNIAFGQSTVTQTDGTDTATGTYNGFSIANNNVVINVTNVTGTFTTDDVITIGLASISGAEFLGKKEVGSYATCFPIKNQTDLALYPAFQNVITTQAAPAAVQNNQFIIKGYYGFVPAFLGQFPITTYQAPNSFLYCANIKLDIPTAYQYPCTNVMVVAQSLYTDMNNEAPFQADIGEFALLNVTVSNNVSTYPSPEVLEQLVSQGNTTTSINDQGIAFWYQRVITIQTISGNTDAEFRYMALQLKKRWFDRNIELTNRLATIDPATGQRVNNTPDVLNNVELRGTNVINAGIRLGICGTINNSVFVGLQPADPARILEEITTTFTPQNNGVDSIVYVNSYTG